MRREILTALPCLALAGAACVDSKSPPAVPKQASIHYGPKVFLVDATVGANPNGPIAGVKVEMCTRLAMELPTGTSTTVTATITPADGVLDVAGMPKPIDARSPHNCYVTVKEKQLKVDVVEVTNDLFQLCVDSGWCERPDPSKASKGQVCSSEDGFDTCPVVEVTQGQASRMCQFLGRRLPSGIEHVIMRQPGAPQDPSMIPVFPNGVKAEGSPPQTCSAAVLNSAGCTKPQPISIISNDTKGAAVLDTVDAANGAKVYDLMGNASEWSSDLIPAIRGLAAEMPWFCQGPLPPSMNAGDPPTCPQDAICVRAQYQPEGQAVGDYPVCIAYAGLRAISGTYGSLFGGNFADNKPDRQHIGVFGRRTEMHPDKDPQKFYGFRCAGDGGSSDDAVEPAP